MIHANKRGDNANLFVTVVYLLTSYTGYISRSFSP